MLTIDLDRAAILPRSRVLDAGCGGGRHTFASLRAGAQVVALDRDRVELCAVAGTLAAMRAESELDGAARVGCAEGDAVALPFSDGAFDCVIASEVLEHLAADGAAITELVRVLRPGGRLALSVPRAGPERVNWALSDAYHEVEGGHLRIYRRRDLVASLEAAGLRLIGSHHAHGLHTPYWWLRCAVGVDRAEQRLVAAYHRLLVWDIVRRPRTTRALEALLNPLIGKSLVLYLEKPS